MSRPMMRSMALGICLALAPAETSAQNMQHTVVQHRVSFSRGQTSATVVGKADYAMSYVYSVGAL